MPHVKAGEPFGRVLTIAGSDPSGGAGIQADLKTITMLGGYGAAALTALTVQNTLGVTGVHSVPPSFVTEQIKSVLGDIGADVVKTGMLADRQTIEAVSKGLEGFDGKLVVDPVMVATSGDRLLVMGALEVLKDLLIARAHVVTPNLAEAGVLTGHAVQTVSDMHGAAAKILEIGAKAVILKGGHLEGDELTDLLAVAGDTQVLTYPKIHTTETHGTGCTLASAVATYLAGGLPLVDAWRQGHAFVQAAIKAAPGFGAGHGPLGHAKALSGKV